MDVTLSWDQCPRPLRVISVDFGLIRPRETLKYQTPAKRFVLRRPVEPACRNTVALRLRLRDTGVSHSDLGISGTIRPLLHRGLRSNFPAVILSAASISESAVTHRVSPVERLRSVQVTLEWISIGAAAAGICRSIQIRCKIGLFVLRETTSQSPN